MGVMLQLEGSMCLCSFNSIQSIYSDSHTNNYKLTSKYIGVYILYPVTF